jgi:hypothetical protein
MAAHIPISVIAFEAAAKADAASDSGVSGKRADLESRQRAVYGSAAMSKLMKMDILVVGLRGLGVEIAKNLCLAGKCLVFGHR